MAQMVIFRNAVRHLLMLRMVMQQLEAVYLDRTVVVVKAHDIVTKDSSPTNFMVGCRFNGMRLWLQRTLMKANDTKTADMMTQLPLYVGPEVVLKLSRK